MKRFLWGIGLSGLLLVSAVSGSHVLKLAHAEPGGCLKYGAVGAVGGHVAGRHGFLGAVGGCVTGMYVRHNYRKGVREDAQKWRDQQAATQGQAQSAPPQRYQNAPRQTSQAAQNPYM